MFCYIVFVHILFHISISHDNKDSEDGTHPSIGVEQLRPVQAATMSEIQFHLILLQMIGV